MRADIIWESLPIHPPRAYRATTAIMQSNVLRLCSIPKNNKIKRKGMAWEEIQTQVNRIITKSSEPKKNVNKSFNYHAKVRKPLNEFLNIGRIQDPRSYIENFKTKETPLVTRKALRKVQLPPMTSNHSIIESLPKTGQHYPFLYPPHFIQSDTMEAIGEVNPAIKELQKNESERLSDNTKGEVVYDTYESNTSQDEEKHNMDTSLIGSVLSTYAMLCSGKGTFTKFISKKTLYAKTLIPFYKVKGQEDETLVFESRFESGNLRRAIKM